MEEELEKKYYSMTLTSRYESMKRMLIFLLTTDI